MSFTKPGVPTPSDAVLSAVQPNNEGQERFARMSESVRALVPEGCTKNDYGWFVLPVNPEKLQAAKIPPEIIVGLQADGKERKAVAALVHLGVTENVVTLRLDSDGGTSVQFEVRPPEYVESVKKWEENPGRTLRIKFGGFRADGVTKKPEAFEEAEKELGKKQEAEVESLLQQTITAIKTSLPETA